MRALALRATRADKYGGMIGICHPPLGKVFVRKKGTISFWNDEKGYGFISPQGGGDRTFVHIKSFANRSRRPVVGDEVVYKVSTDEQGRLNAARATIKGASRSVKPKQFLGTIPILLAVGFIVAISAGVMMSAIPPQLLIAYSAVSLVTFAAYAVDKAAAKSGAWRVSENTLHLLSILGGWPGALIAQNQMRHKTRKQPFRAVFWVTVLLNCAALAWLLTTPEGEEVWRSLASAVPF